MIYYTGIGITFFLLLVLITKRDKQLADIILACWLFVIGVHIVLFTWTLQPVTMHNIHQMMGVSVPFPLIHGPFLYLYTAASTNNFPKRKRWVWHFLPFLITVLFLIPLYAKTAAEKMEIFRTGGEGYRSANAVLLILLQFSGLCYIIWSFYLLKLHKKNIGNQFSYEEKINLGWLRYLVYGLLVIWIVIIMWKKNSLIFGSAVLFVTILGLLGIRQVGIFAQRVSWPPDDAANTDSPETEVETLSENDLSVGQKIEANQTLPDDSKEIVTSVSKKKYTNSGLSEAKISEIHHRLTTIMESDQLFTEPELSLTTLATRLGVHPNYLSQVINEKEEKSFFDYINYLRVEMFKQLVAAPGNEKFTLLSIAYDCGFNSKSSFNKNFKKATGLSPSEFLDSITRLKSQED